MELICENVNRSTKLINRDYIMNNDKATFNNLANSRKFYSHANLLDNYQNKKSINQQNNTKTSSFDGCNSTTNQQTTNRPFILNNSIIQYYDEKPISLISSQSSYYLSSFQDETSNDDETSSDDNEFNLNNNINTTTIEQHRSLKSNFELNTLVNNQFLDKNKLNSLADKSTINKKDDNLTKNLSQFLIKSRSRSSSPRASFKNRKSFNQKHNNRIKQSNSLNQNDIQFNSNSSTKSTISSTSSILGRNNSQDDQFYSSNLNNQVLANKVAEQYIKENYGLLSNSELKSNDDEPPFNAFDLKSLRYSFNKVLKRKNLFNQSENSNQHLQSTNNKLNKLSIDHHTKLNNLQIINNNQQITSLINNNTNGIKKDRNTSLMDLIANNQKLYWCELPIVVESGILNKLDSKQRQLQEAQFELIASEASYLRSLNLLIKNFYMNTFFCDTNIIDARKKEDLFSNILDVVKVSQDLFNELEQRWLESINIQTFCDIIHRFSLKRFQVYMNYCRFKKRQEKTLRFLREKPKFNGILRLLESDSKLSGLSLSSFLLLPVQRITRYPLLIEAILNRTDSKSDTYQLTQECLKTCNEIVILCNAAAKQYEDYDDLIPKLRFTNIKCFPMLCNPRWLINICDVIKVKQETQSTTLIGSFRAPNWSKSNVCLILLSDLIVIAKKKSDDIYIVIDFCNRNSIEFYDVHPIDENRTNINSKMWDNFKHLIKVVFLCNYANKKVDFYFNFSSEEEKLNWLTLAIRTEKKRKLKINNKNIIDNYNLKFFEKQNSADNSTEISIIDNLGQQRTVHIMKQFNQSNDSKDSHDHSDVDNGDNVECTHEIIV